jgi:hypothetical protein
VILLASRVTLQMAQARTAFKPLIATASTRGLRRPKTIEELQAGAEYVELFDRRFLGRMSRGSRR